MDFASHPSDLALHPHPFPFGITIFLDNAKLKIVWTKNCNILQHQTTRFNHTMIFFKLIDYYKLSDIYIDIYMSHNICLGHVNYIVIIKSITRCVIKR